MRIIIEVEGGLVHDIHLDSTEGDLEIYVLDKDNQEVGERGLCRMDWTNRAVRYFDDMIKEAETLDSNPYSVATQGLPWDEEIP